MRSWQGWTSRCMARASHRGLLKRGYNNMTENEALLLATRLYVRMRANGGRVIDAVWMTQDASYAREVLRLAYAHADEEVHRLADRFVETSGAVPSAKPQARPAAAATAEPSGASVFNNRYVGVLR